jgi:hypothetical protein
LQAARIKEGFATETVEAIFHNAGMRSGIESSLCARCPRDPIQGCCTISPVFLLTDIGYFLNNDGEGFLRDLLNSPFVEVSEDQLRVIAIEAGPQDRQEEPGQQSCRFHHMEIGCRLPLRYRNTVCRQFLCPDVKLWQDARVKRWVDFWLCLQQIEIECQQLLADECARRGVSLKYGQDESMQLIKSMYGDLWPDARLPGGYPEMEIVLLERQHQGVKGMAISKK